MPSIFCYRRVFIAFLLISPVAVFAGEKSGNLFPLGLTPLYERPVYGSLPVSYCEPGDTCRCDSAVSDSSGAVWVFVTNRVKSGWVLKSAFRPLSEGSSGLKTGTASAASDPDARRRYRIVEGHPEWQRRIVKAVREGSICLDMNEQQVLASWGEPVQKGRAFILGAGEQDIFYYKNAEGATQTVFLMKGRVVGWSVK